jgi:hypothetical protein
MVLVGLYDLVFDFHQALLAKLPPSLPVPDQTHPPTKKTKLPLVMLVSLILFRSKRSKRLNLMSKRLNLII